MATIGQPLTAPEAGWTRYDDLNPYIKYTGAWLRETFASHYSGSVAYSTDPAGKVTFKFRGTKLRIISPAFTNKATDVPLTIDGVSYTFSEYHASPTVYQVLVFEKTDLPYDMHTVTISRSPNTPVGGNFAIDAIDIDDTGSFGVNLNIAKSSKAVDLSAGSKTNVSFSGGALTIAPGTTRMAYGTTDATPKMTSATAPSGTVASTSEQTGKEGWRAFNDTTQNQGWVTLSGVLTASLTYDFGAPKVVNKYTIKTGTVPTEAPNSWWIEGWNGITWIILDARESQSFAASELKTYTFYNETAYSKYRIRVTKNNGQATTLGIAQMEWMEGVPSFLYSGSGVYESLAVDLSPRMSAIDSVRVAHSLTPRSIGVNEIPAMTNYTTPSGVASASSERVGDGSPAWRAFDKASTGWAGVPGMPQWVAYQFTVAKNIQAYAITASGAPDTTHPAPHAWRFEGSNDGTTWTALDEKSGEIFGANERRMYTFLSAVSYTRYRLYITEISNPAGIRVYVPEVEMMTVDYGAQSVAIGTSTSPDLQTFSDYETVDADGTIHSPDARYIKVKAELAGATDSEGRIMAFGQINQPDYNANGPVVFDDTLHTTSSQPLTVTQDTTFADATHQLYRVTLNLANLSNISKVVVTI